MLPAELIEAILYYADGCLLWRARRVCKLWKQIADFLINERHQMRLCCRRELDRLSAAELHSLRPDVAGWLAVYRGWYRHRLIARWPATTLPPARLYSQSAHVLPACVALAGVDGDSILVASSGRTVDVFDTACKWQYQLLRCDGPFATTQVAVSRPPDSGPRSLLLALGFSNHLVRVTFFEHDVKEQRVALSTLPLRTCIGDELVVSSRGDLVAVCCRWEAWLYRVRRDNGHRNIVNTVCVVDLSFADCPWARAICCSDQMAYLALCAGRLGWCSAEPVAAAAGRHGTLAYSVLQLLPHCLVDGRLAPDSGVDVKDALAIDFNRANLAMSVGADVLLGHVERGCTLADAFTTLRSRVSAVRLHGRLLLLGTENGTLAVYFVRCESALPELDLSNPAARLRLAHSPLRRLHVLEEARGVRVLGHDDQGTLHQCFWTPPTTGRGLQRHPASLLAQQYSPPPRLVS